MARNLLLRAFTVLLSLLSLAPFPLHAVSSGSLSGAVQDTSGVAIPPARLTLINIALRTEIQLATDGQGAYSFPSLAVGRYEITVEATGFKTQRKTNLTVDADAALRIDITLEIGPK